jgi:hypothetical protein
MRGLFELSQMFLLLPLAGLVVGLLIAAGIALWHRHFRRMASSICAIASILVCIVAVSTVPLFDPWLWYAIANRTQFEALAASGPLSNGPKYALVEGRDVSTGLAGASPNHFVWLIYDESDAISLEPSRRPSIWRTRTINSERDPTPAIPKGRRLYGHLFLVDDFE